MAGRWCSPSTPVSPTNKTDRYNIAEILLKVALNTINLDLLVKQHTGGYCFMGIFYISVIVLVFF